MRCAAYTRTTSWKKGLDLKDYTVERQAAAVAAYITGRGWELTKNYSDKSGNSGFFAMQDAGLAREFDTVVFPSIYFVTDDFPLVTQRLQEALYPAGVQIAVVDEDFYSGEKSVDEVADYFEAKRRERHSDIAKNWKESKGDGFVLTNSVPFGFIRRNGETQMVIDEELRPIVTEMFRMKAKGIRVGLIADWLNRNGVDTPSMRRKKMYGRETDRAAEMWNSEMVSKLLVSPVYTGARVDARKRVVKENCYEPYLSREQFEAIFPGKYRYAEEKTVRKSYAKSLPVFCAGCGKRMVYRYGLYRCDDCGNYADAATVEKAVKDAVDKEKKQAGELEAEVKAGAVDDLRMREAERVSVKMKTILAETELEQVQRVPLYDSFKAGEITEKEYNLRLADMRASYKALDGKLSACMEERTRNDKTYSVKNSWLALFAGETKGSDTLQRYVQNVTAEKGGTVTAALKEGTEKEKLMRALGREAE